MWRSLATRGWSAQARGVLAACCLGGAGPAAAAELEVSLASIDGAVLVDAVVSLHSTEASARIRPVVADLDQRDGQFVPRVLPVTVGTMVGFPNSDKVRHHVYSFSPTKRFELPLFSGRAGTPVTFDRAGVAVLGCNIHDWMVAYVVVLDTPHFAMSDAAGRARIEAPPGDYTLRVWHERLPSDAAAPERALVLDAGGGAEHFELELGSPPLPQVNDRRLRPPPERRRDP
jgi:plastocyanin